MRVLFGTTNPGKLRHMRDTLTDLDIEIVGFEDIGMSPPKIHEGGKDPLENARIKALAYYELANMPVFSCDSGLFIEGLIPQEQPGFILEESMV